MQVDRKRVAKAFREYVAGYDLSDGKIALKAEHTLRVAALCDRIAESLKLAPAEQGASKSAELNAIEFTEPSPAENNPASFSGLSSADRGITESYELSVVNRDTAWLCGMLHDIGRFEQVRRWGTFYDSQSVNHAEFGADLLFKEGLIDHFVDNCDLAVETAIRNHNRLRVEEGLDARTQALCDILRDADKIDILRVNVERPSTEIYGATLDEIMTTGISPEVEADFYACRCADRKHMHTLLDRRIGHLCFTYELVYPYSLQQMVNQGYLAQALALTSSDPAIEAKLTQMRTFMNNWLAARIL